MRGSFFGLGLLALGLAVALPVQGDPAPPAEAWSPVRVFIGSWTGTTDAEGGKLTRQVASSEDNRRLVVLERAGDDVASWGEIAYDADRHNLVLLPREGDPELVLLPFDPARAPGQLVFASATDGPKATRLTYEFKGWNEYVERVEKRGADGKFWMASEKRFKRGTDRL